MGKERKKESWVFNSVPGGSGVKPIKLPQGLTVQRRSSSGSEEGRNNAALGEITLDMVPMSRSPSPEVENYLDTDLSRVKPENSPNKDPERMSLEHRYYGREAPSTLPVTASSIKEEREDDERINIAQKLPQNIVIQKERDKKHDVRHHPSIGDISPSSDKGNISPARHGRHQPPHTRGDISTTISLEKEDEPRLPPGVTIRKELSLKQRLPPGVTVQVEALKLPDGISLGRREPREQMFSTCSESEAGPSSRINQGRNSRSGVNTPPIKKNPQIDIGPRIDMVQVQPEIDANSDEDTEGDLISPRKSSRQGNTASMAKIRAALRADSNSDEEFGQKIPVSPRKKKKEEPVNNEAPDEVSKANSEKKHNEREALKENEKKHEQKLNSELDDDKQIISQDDEEPKLKEPENDRKLSRAEEREKKEREKREKKEAKEREQKEQKEREKIEKERVEQEKIDKEKKELEERGT